MSQRQQRIPPFEVTPPAEVYRGANEQLARYDLGRVQLFLGAAGLERVRAADEEYTALLGDIVTAMAEERSVADFSDFDTFRSGEHGTFYRRKGREDEKSFALWEGRRSLLLANFVLHPALSALVARSQTMERRATVVSEPSTNEELKRTINDIQPETAELRRRVGSTLQPTRLRLT